MTTFNEQEIRERLELAVAPIDPLAPPLDVLRARAVKLRRFRISVGGGLLAAAAAAVTVAVVVVPANGSSSVQVASTPSTASLTSYAATQDGKHVTGPVLDGNQYVGAFATKKAIVVVRYASGAWHADGKPVTKYGPGRYVRKLQDGGSVIPGATSFVVHTIGGDVSYFGGVLYDAKGTWTAAKFATCGHQKLCAAGDEEPYGHLAAGNFTSVSNDCLPYCAAGTNYRITWLWSGSAQRFQAVKDSTSKA
jgi:hypothetical protein